MAFTDVLRGLFYRDAIEPLSSGDEVSPIASYYLDKMQLSSQRIKKYKDYTDMAQDTLISGALDIYADESAIFDRVENATIWPESDNEQVETEIRKLFDAIEIEDYIFGMQRYLACYGDNFLRPLYSKERKGIVGMEFMDAENVEREVDKHNRLVSFKYDNNKKADPWGFVHFRVMGRTQTVKQGGTIYGTSMLENARRTWRQLTLLEDALVIYRLEIGGRHRVFYIDVGNMSLAEALRVTRQYRREFGKREYFNPQSGEWTSRFNPLQLTSDIFWPVRKGSESRIDHLGTDPNVSAIVDIEHFRTKLMSALKIPEAYIGGDEYSSAKFGLSQIDINFSRFVRRLQRAAINGVRRLAQIDLALKGINPLDPQNDFDIVMSVISALDQEQRMMAMDLAITLASKLKDLGGALGIPDQALSSYISRHILGLTPYDLRALGKDDHKDGGGNGKMGPAQRQQIMTEALKVIRTDPSLSRMVKQLRANGDDKVRSANSTTTEQELPYNRDFQEQFSLREDYETEFERSLAERLRRQEEGLENLSISDVEDALAVSTDDDLEDE